MHSLDSCTLARSFFKRTEATPARIFSCTLVATHYIWFRVTAFRIVSYALEHMSLEHMSQTPSASAQDQMEAMHRHIAQQQEQFAALQREFAEQQHRNSTLQAQLHSAQAASAAAPQNQEASHHSGGAHFLARASRPSEFTGQVNDNPESWLSQIETFFQLGDVRDDSLRVRSVGLFFRGPALSWWNMTQKVAEHSQQPLSWEEFKAALMARFLPVDVGRIARAKLNTLSQKGCKNLADYTEQFQRLMQNINDMGVTDQIDRYRQGLVLSLQRELAHKDFTTLAAIMTAATRTDLVERQINPHLRPFVQRFNQPHNKPEYRGGYQAPRQSSFPSASTAVPMELGNINNNGAGRVPGLTQDEFRRLRAEGKCFRCKKTGHVANRCPNSKPGAPQRRPPGRVNAVRIDDEDQGSGDDEHTGDDRLNGSPQ